MYSKINFITQKKIYNRFQEENIPETLLKTIWFLKTRIILTYTQ